MSDAIQFSTFGAVTFNDGSTVDIPADRSADFARAATYFSAHTNRHTMTVGLVDSNGRPSESEAKLFARQAKQYAETHNLSTSPKRDGHKVTFRFAKKRDESKANGPVTVSNVNS